MAIRNATIGSAHVVVRESPTLLGSNSIVIQQGQFVEVRGRPWLVEAVDDSEPDLTTLRLSCIADDAQGEQIEVLWDAEIGTRIIDDDTWSQVGRGAPDSPEVLASRRSSRPVQWPASPFANPRQSLPGLLRCLRSMPETTAQRYVGDRTHPSYR
jgi:hypothetical protein